MPTKRSFGRRSGAGDFQIITGTVASVKIETLYCQNFAIASLVGVGHQEPLDFGHGYALLKRRADQVAGGPLDVQSILAGWLVAEVVIT